MPCYNPKRKTKQNLGMSLEKNKTLLKHFHSYILSFACKFLVYGTKNKQTCKLNLSSTNTKKINRH